MQPYKFITDKTSKAAKPLRPNKVSVDPKPTPVGRQLKSFSQAPRQQTGTACNHRVRFGVRRGDQSNLNPVNLVSPGPRRHRWAAVWSRTFASTVSFVCGWLKQVFSSDVIICKELPGNTLYELIVNEHRRQWSTAPEGHRDGDNFQCPCRQPHGWHRRP